MKAVVQRVLESSVTIAGETVASIDRGMMILLGVTHDDTREDLEWLAAKIAKLRIFDDHKGVMNLDIRQVKGEILVVSQFTLHSSTRKGNRPSYIAAAPAEVAIPLYEKFMEVLSAQTGIKIQHGVFGADMKVSLVNDGPVTIIIDTKNKQ